MYHTEEEICLRKRNLHHGIYNLFIDFFHIYLFIYLLFIEREREGEIGLLSIYPLV